MPTLVIRGHSDDLIVVEGAITEEFAAWDSGDNVVTRYLLASDGSALAVRYTEEGIWRFAPVVVAETSIYYNKQATADGNSDIVELESSVPFTWVGLANTRTWCGPPHIALGRG